MKKIVIAAVLIFVGLVASAQDSGKKEIVKTGWNIGPLPAIAFDADKGFQLGAILQLFNYGDGSNYPNYDSKWYFEGSFFTKGSQLYQVMYDNKELIPGIRWSSAASVAVDKAMDFYGFNGYQSYYDFDAIKAGKDGKSFIFTPFYKMARVQALFKTDFVGDITDHLKWEAGYHASYFKIGEIDYDNINKGKTAEQDYPSSMPTLYGLYRQWGLITDAEANGGFSSSVCLGMTYDTRDKEGAPSRGIWAEAHVTLAPKWLGTKNPYYRYSATFRHYVPIVKNDVLTFAYRLNYEGNFGNNCPFYVLPYITVMGENVDKDGMGGYRTTRGLVRGRVVGLDMFTYNAEFRWRFARFLIGKQNIALGLSVFSDGTMVTRGRNMVPTTTAAPSWYKTYVSKDTKEIPHFTCGAGFRFIMNENFIVAAEYGTPFTNFLKNSPHYKQDGTGAFYINIGYLF